MLPGNLLTEHRRLTAVIDWGGLGVGDPAPDLMAGWALFHGDSRRLFREALNADEALWTRGRGHALSQAVIYLPYYWHTHPAGVAQARRTLESLVRDPR